MRIVENDSPYDTKALRRIMTRVHRAITKREGKSSTEWWEKLRVYVLATRGSIPHYTSDFDRPVISLHIPRLKGDEFIAQLRQLHGGLTPEQAAKLPGLRSHAFALLWQGVEYGFRTGSNFARVRFSRSVVVGSGQAEDPLRGLPDFVKLRVIKPKPERDPLADRRARTEELIKTWTRKRKLAETKLKLYRQKARRYARQAEKRVAAREANDRLHLEQVAQTQARASLWSPFGQNLNISPSSDLKESFVRSQLTGRFGVFKGLAMHNITREVE